MIRTKCINLFGVLILGLFVNIFAEDFLLSSKTRINEYNKQLAPLPAIAVEPTSYRQEQIASVHKDKEHITMHCLPDPTVDTLRNHDRTPSFYYSRDSVYYATRLTMPTAASPCSIKVIRFGLYRPRSSSSMLCSLFVWRDTIINGIHRPGIALHNRLYVISSWQVGYWSWNYVTLSTPIVLQPNEDFWLGFFGLASDVNQLSDGSENLDSTRNEIRVAGGIWQSNQYDFLQEAVVSYVPVDSNVGITGIGGVGKIVFGNSTVTITATVKNFGRTTLPAGIPISLKIVGPSVVYETTAHTQTSISYNNTTTVTFESWQFPNISGDYEIKVWTNLAEDPIPANDTMSMNSFVYTSGYLETFMSDFPPPGWIIFNFNGNNQWSKTNSIYFADEGSARILWDPVPQAPNNDWLITPRFKAYANDSLIFWYRAASSEFYETLLVRVDTILNGLDTTNFSIIIDTVITNSTEWQHRIIPFNRILTDSAGVYVAFHYPCYSNFYIAIDDVILPGIDTVYDFFPVSFNTPKLPIIIDSTYIVSATFRNNSITQEVLSLYVFYQIVGDSTFYKDSVWIGIGGGNYEDVQFANFSPTVSETVAIKIWTAYPDDENKHNDTLFKKVFIAPKFYSVPYEKDFNEDWGVYGDNPPLGGWRIIQGGRDTIWNTNDWYRDTIRIGDSVRQVAMVYYNPLENQFERLISPRIDCSNPGLYNLHYWHWYQNYDPSLRDSGVVLISTNGGSTWPIRVARYFNTNDSGYKTINISSSVAGQSDVRVCFLYGGYNEYWWAIDDFSVEWIPFGPVLLSPINGFETYNQTIQFAWQPINNVLSYLIEIAYDSLFQATVISETVNVDTISFAFEPETYYWRVKAVRPIGQYSETRKFKVISMPVGWVKYPNIPIPPNSKPVKDGGAVCFCPVDSNIYVLKGNNTREIYALYYFLGNHNWITKPSVPIDTAKRRNVKKGSAICFAESLIYVIKGNKTNEFYAYNPRTDSWIRKRNVPGTKGLTAGTSITFVPPMSKITQQLFHSENLSLNTNKGKQESGYIYLLKGSSKEFELLAYSIANDSWEIRARAPAGPNNKKFKAGSSIVYSEQDNKIYALKGGSKYNEFYFYDITADTWSHFPGDTLPLPPVKDGGALTYCDGKIYAIKGGGRSNEFWCYSESLGEKRWRMLDTIPKYSGLPKAGASLTAGAGIIYLLKGNNTTECWAYFPRSEDKSISKNIHNNTPNLTANNSSLPVESGYRFNIEVKPNLVKDFINICYSINEPMSVRIKLYDVTGQVLETIKDANIIRPGIYQQRLSITNLASGIYFISLESQQKKSISKFIVQ